MKKLYLTGVVICMVLFAYIFGYGHGQYDSYKKKTDDVSLMDVYK